MGTHFPILKMKLLLSLAVLATLSWASPGDEDIGLTNSRIRSLLSSADIRNKRGQRVSIHSMKGKYIGLYFSAKWCSPCRRMTPVLVDAYRKNSDNFEIVWISSDRSESAADYYYQQMPWTRIRYSDRTGKDLFSAVRQRYIPTLTILGPDLNKVNINARSAVESGRSFPWRR